MWLEGHVSKGKQPRPQAKVPKWILSEKANYSFYIGKLA